MRHSIAIIVFSLCGLNGCARADSFDIRAGSINLADSYIYPYSIKINDDGRIPGGGLAKCAEYVGLNAIASTTITGKPRFVMVEWENLLSGKAYQAKVPLNKKTSEWLKLPPFENYDPTIDAPALVVEWRGHNRIAVMLVANFTRFSKGTIGLGEIVGEEIPTPEDAAHITTYPNLTAEYGEDYRPGRVRNYERARDDKLSLEQRFGCPRLPNGNIDESKLPPEKLPFLIGENGEHIPCEEYFCADKRELKDKLMSLPRQRYPKDKQPPSITFQDAPHPRPAW